MKLDVAAVRLPGGYERTTPSVAFAPTMRSEVNRAGEGVGRRDPRVDRERGPGVSIHAADLSIASVAS